MKKIIGLILSLFSTYAPMFTEEVELLNQIGRVKEKGDWYYCGSRQHNANFTLRDFQIKKFGFTVY
ncbi:hypothetical protein [Bacillus cereus]